MPDPDRPWTVDQLAEMHAGALDDAAAAEMWSRVREDQDAMAVLDALTTTRAELAGLREAPPAPMPEDVAARIDAALAAERARIFPSTAHQPAVAPPMPPQPYTQVTDLAQARRRRNRQLGWGAGLLTAAAAVIAAVAIALPSPSTQGTPLADDDPAKPDAGQALSLSRDDVGAGANKTIGVTDFGPFGDRAGLDACLRANQIAIDDELLGVRPATVDGERAVLVVFTTGELARYRMLAFPADCGEGNPGMLFDEVVGG